MPSLQSHCTGSQHLSLESLRVLVNEFYADVRKDVLLAPIFNGAIGDHWPSHIDRLVSFWATVSIGARSFSGNVYGKHMALEGVSHDHFQRWLTLWCQHTNRIFVVDDAASLQVTALGIARHLFQGYFMDPEAFHAIQAELPLAA